MEINKALNLETAITNLSARIQLLTQAVTTNTIAINQNTTQETLLMADLTQLTSVVQQLAADDSALKTALDAVVAALNAAKAGGFTPQNQADLDAAVAALTATHDDLVADAVEATTAASQSRSALGQIKGLRNQALLSIWSNHKINLDIIFKNVVGPYGALFLLLVAVVYLWRKLEASEKALGTSRRLLEKQQDLFDEALKIIKDDLIPLVKEIARK